MKKLALFIEYSSELYYVNSMNVSRLWSNPLFRFILLLVVFIALYFIGKILHINLDQVQAWLAQYPLWLSGFLFILLYVGITALLWVGTIDFFRTTAALLFGPYVSTILVYIAEIVNAGILFMLSRNLGREYIQQRFRLKEKDLGRAANSGFWWALALRMNMVVPFRFMDLGFGLTKLPFSKYLLAVILGSPLRIFLVQMFIFALGESMLKSDLDPQAAFQIAYNYFMSNQDILYLTLIYGAAVVILTVVAIIMSYFAADSSARPQSVNRLR